VRDSMFQNDGFLLIVCYSHDNKKDLNDIFVDNLKPMIENEEEYDLNRNKICHGNRIMITYTRHILSIVQNNSMI